MFVPQIDWTIDPAVPARGTAVRGLLQGKSGKGDSYVP
jgi:hypothetical protein